ncbi:mitochondrial 37S ribosomal protein MRPS35 [Sugiyamaella lignohabitans]|uniref:Mitochondrial 37S ribosomal protein MRPS35 n=1 Tax=Sugiyamaella lignohabitans TaxID=796027 RepID=A0A167E0J4_9ASCO|nr:mitochondrial 37S ribosomal protein MRPS35 [Sugiyamaella lignohabitans]ANB13504.1 mitochondrial 37S ribosomal protein MRPS35 [Sugiyamaella lignohabitans]
MRKMNTVMKSIFTSIKTDRDTGLPFEPVDNMTEIPIPEETRHQRFMSIAESEPFGPVDAAEALGIEPAAVTLEKLTQHDSIEETSKSSSTKTSKLSFFAPVLEGERTAFRFTDAKVGEVGYRYGASKDDRRHARKVKYQPSGKMVWA